VLRPTSRRRGSPLLALLLLVPTVAAAQASVEITPFIGSFYALSSVSEQTNVPLPSFGGAPPGDIVREQDDGPMIGARVSFPLTGIIRAEGSFGFAFSNGRLDQRPRLDPDAGFGVSANGHVYMLSARALIRPRRQNFYGIAGLGLVGRGGDSLETADQSARVAGVIELGVRRQPAPESQLSAEAFLYSFSYSSANIPNSDSKFQQDIVVSVGIPIGTLRRHDMSNRVLLSVALLGLLLAAATKVRGPDPLHQPAGRKQRRRPGHQLADGDRLHHLQPDQHRGLLGQLRGRHYRHPERQQLGGSAFTAWGEACTGAIATCEVTLDDSKDVTAQFTLANPRTLTVAGGSGSGSGSGTIISSPGGLNCAFNGDNVSGTCSADFADGAVVTLSALPVVGSGFTTWGGDCAAAAGAGTCNLTMSAARNATAQFVSVSFSGLLASASDDQSGLIVVSIPTASASIGRTKGTGVSLSAAGRADVIATGTIRFLNGEPRAIAGTYDTENQVLEVTSATGFDMTASFSGEAFDGVYFDAVQTGGPTMPWPRPARPARGAAALADRTRAPGTWSCRPAGERQPLEPQWQCAEHGGRPERPHHYPCRVHRRTSRLDRHRQRHRHPVERRYQHRRHLE
jgi:hypothetical protein